MSHVEFIITAEKKDISVIIEPTKSTTLKASAVPGLIVVAAGNVGPPGPPGREGKWVAMTQNEYDLLNPPDPNTLYVIIQ